MPTKIGQRVTVFPFDWLSEQLGCKPEQVDEVTPQGLGIGGPFVVRPWDKPFSASPARYYGYQPWTGNPFHDAPVTDSAGGVVYFHNLPEEADFKALLRLMGVYATHNDYAVLLREATNTLEDRYLTQVRIVCRFALGQMFQAFGATLSQPLPEQPLSIGELMWQFIGDQQEAYGTTMGGKLSGAMGGDGDWAKEELAFGLMVENTYQGVYRMWSRAWLVTK